MTTTTHGYAIVDAHGVIRSLHDEALPAGEGWGFDRELIALRRAHTVGDRIEYDSHGEECLPSHQAE